MAYKIIRDYNGAIVRRSRDLRAILDNSAKRATYVKTVTITKHNDAGILNVQWGNGDESTVKFNDYGIALIFVMQSASWVGADIIVNGELKGQHTVNLMRYIFSEWMER